MRIIPLSHTNLGSIVDDVDYVSVMRHSWCLDQHGYAVSRIKQKKVYLHRFITGDPKGEYVDHRNGDVLDNRKSNLRICSKTENNRNRDKNKNNTSGFKGVTWNKRAGKWQAQIGVNYKNNVLGLFPNKEEANEAYKAAAESLFGEFAYTMRPC